MPRPEKSPVNHSFSRYLMLWMLVLVLCMVGFLTVNDYLYAKNIFHHEKETLRLQTEQNIEQAIRFKDALWDTYDTSLNERMEDGLKEVLAEYERAGHDPALMDLQGVKEKIGGNYDIYVIDESGVIVYTTFAPELGWDFKKFPEFYAYITRIRSSDGFFPDRIVNEMGGEGKFRKYSYMPTSDHKYLLELGLTGRSFETLNERITLNEHIDSIVSVNPYAERYRIFNSMGRRTDDNHLPEPEVQERIAESIRAGSVTEYYDPVNRLTSRYLFIDMKDPKYGSDPSRVIEIIYSDRKIDAALSNLLLFHLLIGSLAIIIGCIIAFILSRRITRPIQEIAEDADTISRGDLDHRIRPTENTEFARLESSINAMVDSLKAALQKTRDDEIFKKEMIDQLPVGVFIKRTDTGRYIFWNRTIERLFDIPANSVLGRTDREVFPEPVVAEIEKEDQILKNNPREVLRKYENAPSSGGTLLHTLTVPVLDSNGNLQYIVGICQDVSHENINLRMDLLFSLTRHEILDNLGVIMNHLERAQLKNTQDEMQMFFDKTIGSIGSIRNQIASMRALQDLGLVTPCWQSVQAAFDDAATLLPEHRVTIRTDLSGIEIFADPLLPRVFHKLLDYSFRTGGSGLTSIRIMARVSNDTLYILYQDDGEGVADTEKDAIFAMNHPSGLYLARELLGFTGITIQEIGVYKKGCTFNIQVQKDRFRIH